MNDEDRSLDVLLKENRLSDRGLTDFLKIIDRDFRYKRENDIALYDVKELVLYELVSRELERNAKRWKVTQEDWPEIKKSLEDVGIIVEEHKEEHKREIPAAEVEPVIRCKECVHGCPEKGHEPDVHCSWWDYPMSPMGFCSKATRKKGEE